MERTLAFTTTLLASVVAHAAHPPLALKNIGDAGDHEVVATRPNHQGRAFARQVLIPVTSEASPKALSRTIYLNRDGVTLFPGDNDAARGRSTLVSEPVEITPWEIDDEMWDETVSCVRDLYARFDVTVTDRDPGDIPHIEAVFGGHPNDVGLPDYVAGVSPYRTDCGVVENSIVFTFTDVLDDDPRMMCEIMAQEIAHSYGLDHEMLAEDPMTYLDYDDDRAFQDEMASCGEDGDRPCGIDGSVCWERQNSVALLTSRLGRRGAEDTPSGDVTTTEPEVSGCSTSGSGGPPGVVILALLALRSRRSSRARRARCR